MDLKVRGKVKYEFFDEKGVLIKSFTVPNTIHTAGFQEIASLLVGSGTGINYIGVGWGTDSDSAINLGDIDLQGISTFRKAITGKTTDGNKAVYVAGFGLHEPVNSTITIYESGLFTASTGGTMIARTIASPLPTTKTAKTSLTITWELTIS
jgi:hypothetical protein